MRLLRSVVVVLLPTLPLGPVFAARSTTTPVELRLSAAGTVAGDVVDFTFSRV